MTAVATVGLGYVGLPLCLAFVRSGLAEIVSLAAVVPFLTVLADPSGSGGYRGSDPLPSLEAAARRAQIADFTGSLPQGYSTIVGERGVRLSGGQRQRMGIARALYKQASVLVFDETTSALDDAAEKALMDTLDGLSRDLTIILIAHRLSTTAYCDRVIRMEIGGVLLPPEPARF